MSANEQFANACNELQQWHVIRVQIIIHHDLDYPPSMTASTQIVGDSFDSAIQDYEMDVAGWRQFGNSIKTSTYSIRCLELETNWQFHGITPGIAQCLQAFFDEVKENKTIEKFSLYFDICTAIPALDLRYFFQNDHSLNEVNFSSVFGSVSPAQSNHLLTALRDLSLKKISIRCSGFANNGAFEQVLFACQMMGELWLKYLDLDKNLDRWSFLK